MEPCAVFFLERDNLGERRGIAIHAENTLCGNQNICFTLNIQLCPLQFCLKVVKVVVLEDPQRGPGQFSGIHDASVNQFVENDDVTFANKRRDGADCSRITIGKN